MATQRSDGALIFEDRADAGRRLALKLLIYEKENPIVLSLPRGGVAVGYEIARALKAPLDVIVARKLSLPEYEELGIGAIAPGGVCVMNRQVEEWQSLTGAELQQIIARETDEMNRRLRLYRGDRPLPDLTGRTVILADDGAATGMTAQAAVQSVRRQQTRRLVLAIPVCASETAQRLEAMVDDLICDSIPASFRAVGLWYRDFAQTTDQKVIDLLRQANLKDGSEA